MNGVEVVAAIREKLHRHVPALVLTGDISTETLRAIAKADCTLLNKPVKLEELALAVRHALAPVTRRRRATAPISRKRLCCL